jgi:hypothetical protein
VAVPLQLASATRPVWATVRRLGSTLIEGPDLAPGPTTPVDEVASGVARPGTALSISLVLHPSAETLRLATRLIAKRAVEGSGSLELTIHPPAVRRPTVLPLVPLEELLPVRRLAVTMLVVSDVAVVYPAAGSIHVVPAGIDPKGLTTALESVVDESHCGGDRSISSAIRQRRTEELHAGLQRHCRAVLRTGLADR